MKTHVRLQLVGSALILSATGFFLAGKPMIAADQKESGQKPVPEDAYQPLVDQSVKIIQEALTNVDKSNKKSLNTAKGKAKTAAYMIAVFAQYSQGGNPKQKAAVRDAALKVAEMIKSDNFDEAKKEAATIANAGLASAKEEPVELMDKLIEMDEVMDQFKPEKSGGLGVEAKLLKLGEASDEIPAKELGQDLVLLAYRAAAVAELIKNHEPDKDKNQWKQFAEEMGKSAVELAKVVKAKDGKAAFKVVTTLNKNCNDCHEKFR